MKKNFSQVIQQIPEEQKRVLERMMRLKLVNQFGSVDTTGASIVIYTPEGKAFLDTIVAVVSQESEFREASLIALDLLARGKPGFGGPVQK